MLKVQYQNKFKKQFKQVMKRGKDPGKLEAVITLLIAEEELPEKYRDHNLAGRWSGFRECHIEPDWLLIYTVKQEELLLILTATGSHSDLFK